MYNSNLLDVQDRHDTILTNLRMIQNYAISGKGKGKGKCGFV